jgi:hypothetical protein
LRALIVIDAAFVAELTLFIEEEDVRRSLGPVSLRHGLRRAVVQVGEIKVAVLRTELHFLEAVAHVRHLHLIDPKRVGIVRLDGDQRHPLSVVVRGEPLDSILI